MTTLRNSIGINSSKEGVWKTLWDDATLRDWANLIDEGTYMVGEMKEGTEVQFISSSSGYGVTSVIEKLTPKEFVFFRHRADTKEGGTEEREKEWTGGTESYSLVEHDGTTTVTIEQEVPEELVEYFKNCMPKVLERIKTLAEMNKV